MQTKASMNEVILVTGARGFVGRHVIEQARDRAVDVVPSEIDLRDADAVGQLVQEVAPTSVIHLAESRAESADDDLRALEDNLRMTLNVLRSLARLPAPRTLLAAGSAAQYGLASRARLSESAPTVPVSPRGEAKCVLERACTTWLNHDVRVVWTRSFNHIGPGQGAETPVGAWTRQAVAAEAAGGGTIRTGTLDVVRDFLDVRDVADAYLDLVASDAEGVVNVCSGRPVELRSLAELVADRARVPIELVQDTALLRGADPQFVVGDPERLHTLTDWSPKVSLEQSVDDALEAVRS
jgi:GDP-4-dehydro-6-deoxy-D-mannose reductase